MSLILRFMIDQMDIMDEMNRYNQFNYPHTLIFQMFLWLETLELQNRRQKQSSVVPPQYSWFNYLHNLIFQVFLVLETLETQRITRAIEQTRESERCGSTSIQLVQLPTHSDIPGVPMVRNTGGSEDCWNYRMDNRIRAMQFHLYTAGSTP